MSSGSSQSRMLSAISTVMPGNASRACCAVTCDVLEEPEELDEPELPEPALDCVAALACVAELVWAVALVCVVAELWLVPLDWVALATAWAAVDCHTGSNNSSVLRFSRPDS